MSNDNLARTTNEPQPSAGPILTAIVSSSLPVTKFNWVAFSCPAGYYAGHGKVGKGILIALFNFIPLTAIISGIYVGRGANAKFEQKQFNWLPAIMVTLLQSVLWLLVAGSR